MPHATTLVIDTSTPVGSIGLWHDGWHSVSFSSDRSHNCDVFPHLSSLLALCENQPLTRIIVGSGPGSYSGTRVGIAVAQGLAIAHSAELVALPSLLGTPTARSHSHVRAIGDARRGDWWWCDITPDEFPLHLQVGVKSDVASRLLDPTPTFSLDAIADESFGKPITQEFPTAELLWQAWLALSPEQQQRAAAEVVQPLYIKPPHITISPKSR
jgi:tRNA threonylcarbamoyl adenosine modification protein YeaZ